jgi:hypothetical protein
MCKLFAILLFFLHFALFLKAQETQQILPPENPDIKKGTLYYTSGSQMKFSGLQFVNDVVIFTDSAGTVKTEPLSDIERIDQPAVSVGKGALIGGITGLIAGLITGSIVHADRSFLQWLIDEIIGEEVENTLKKEEVPYIVGGLVVGAGIGALIGLQSKKEKTVYRRNPEIDLFPGISSLPGNQQIYTVNVSLRLRGKQ